jgi:tetratricopeptide (TPR) repeat protein
MLRNLVIIGISLLAIQSIFSQPKNRTFIDNQRRLMLLGEFEREVLTQSPFDQWFTKQYNLYSTDSVQIDFISAHCESVDSITVFLGTWCGDSRREVPRFLKIMDQSGIKNEKIRLIALNRGRQNNKQSPSHEEVGMNIHRVPTFIFHDSEGNEINRMVEFPVETLERDISKIFSGESYTPNYRVVSELISLFENEGLHEIQQELPELAVKYQGMVMNRYELNTYAYVLMSAFKMGQAELVFELNALIFPNESMPHKYLGMIKACLGKYEEALSSYEQTLLLDPDDEEVIHAIKSLKTS